MIHWKYIPLLAVLIVLIVGLSACASTPGEFEDAYTHRENIKPLEPLVKIVDDVSKACLNIGTPVHANFVIAGCADPYGRFFPNHCLIYVPKDDPGWILKHELLHCLYGRWHR